MSLAATRKRRRKPFQPSVTYQLTVTDAEREKIHAAVDALAGKVENMRPNENENPNTLVGALAKGLPAMTLSPMVLESLVWSWFTPLR